jgi:hypothetical protein
MDEQALARLLLRMAGLVIVIYALVGLPGNVVTVLGFLSSSHGRELPSFGQALTDPRFWGMSFAPSAIYLATGLSLFRWSGRLVNFVVLRHTEKHAHDAADYQAIEEIAVSVLGAYLCAEGLVEIARWAAVEFTERIITFWLTEGAILLSGAVYIVIGIMLLFWCRGFVALRRFVSLRLSGS